MYIREYLKDKTSTDIKKLLSISKIGKYFPRYIDATSIFGAAATIDTWEWEFVSPQYLIGEGGYTGKWLSNGSAGLLNNDKLILKILNYKGKPPPAIIPANGGSIKYRKKMSRRRYRYKNRKSLKK